MDRTGDRILVEKATNIRQFLHPAYDAMIQLVFREPNDRKLPQGARYLRNYAGLDQFILVLRLHKELVEELRKLILKFQCGF